MKRAWWLAALVVSCRTAQPTLTTRPVAEVEPNAGRVSATLIPDRDSPSVELGPGEEYMPPQIVQKTPPTYPAALLSLNLPRHVVVMRITFDEHGLPIAIVPSPVAASTDSRYRGDFETAVAAAMQRWSSSAARIRKFKPGPDSDGDGKPDYRILVSERVLKAFFDVSFSFEVVNGQPVVKAQ